MTRDRIIGVVAVMLSGVACLMPWLTVIARIFDNAPGASLLPADIPIGFLYRTPGTGGARVEPSIVWVPIAVTLLGLVALFLPGLARRILFVVLGVMAGAVATQMSVQFAGVLDKARHLTTASSSDTVFAHLGLGVYVLAGAGVVFLVAGIVGAGKKGKAARQQGAAAATPASAPMPFAQPQAAATTVMAPQAPYPQPSDATQQWATGGWTPASMPQPAPQPGEPWNPPPQTWAPMEQGQWPPPTQTWGQPVAPQTDQPQARPGWGSGDETSPSPPSQPPPAQSLPDQAPSQ